MSDTIDFGIYNGLEWDKLSTEYLNGLADMGNVQAKEQLEKIYNSPIETQKIGFGKFSNYKWVDVDSDYLLWIIENVDVNNIKYTLALKALEYIKNNTQEEDLDIIYLD
jgi:uncharacterized protein (DUF3820 family)|tara:strand:- start:2103 stop:2429 length:327 start_codon:yes stop_codon:yes gene_type:complete